MTMTMSEIHQWENPTTDQFMFDECTCDRDYCPVAMMNYRLAHSDSRAMHGSTRVVDNGAAHQRGRRQEREEMAVMSHSALLQEQMVALVDLFTQWDELHRLQFVDTMLDRCQPSLVRYLRYETTRRLKRSFRFEDYSQDFTRILPRTTAIRIFSYLDVATLARCAQVCGYWKYLTECNEIWERKFRLLNIRLPSTLQRQLSQNGTNNQRNGNVHIWKDAIKQYFQSHNSRQHRRKHSGALVPSYAATNGGGSNGTGGGSGNGNGHKPSTRPAPQYPPHPTRIPQPPRQHHRTTATLIQEERTDEQTLVFNPYSIHRYGSSGAIIRDLDTTATTQHRKPSPPYHYDGTRHVGSGRATSAQRGRTTVHAPVLRVGQGEARASSAHGGRKVVRGSGPMAPWRPSAQHPEDMYFEKFGKKASKTAAESAPHRFRPSSSNHHILRATTDKEPYDQFANTPSNFTIAPKALHTRQGNGPGNGHHSHANGNVGGSRETNAQRNAEGNENSEDEEAVHWRAAKGGIVGYVDTGDADEEDDEQEDEEGDFKR